MDKINKSGKLFSIWWVLVMVIVTVAVVMSTSFFYTSYADIRALEAESLAIRFSNCISNGAVIDSNLLNNCGIEPSFFETNSKYFVKVSFEELEYKFGNNAFETDCKFSSMLKANNYPRCVEKSVNINNKDVKILAGANNFGKEIKLQ